MEIRKELNLGYSDFKNIIESNNYFVDKSLLIKDVIKAEKAVLLIPRPRRFGKTLNLTMLKYFFEINQPENEKLFTQLKIWQSENEIKEKRGKYPVIFLSFKDAKDENWKYCLELIKDEIIELYAAHNYLLDSNKLAENEKKDYLNILNKTALKTTYQGSLKKLCKHLYNYYNQQVVILIDEYDTPIQAGYKKFYDKVISFMCSLLSGAFKDNKYLYKGVITGILRVSRESIFTGLNNISVFSVLDNQISDKFGFTENEVKQILQDFKVPTEYEQVKKWYNGYKFGKTSDIYNPWSILNYAQDFESGFKPFWVNTSSDELIKECLKERDANYTREQLLNLINNETIEKNIDENFVFPDLDTDKELLWTLLTFSGYLTTESKLDYNTFNLKIPNYEIKLVFKNIIKKWLSSDIKIKQTLLINTTKYLISKDLENFEIGFKEIIGDTFSYFDTKGEPENVYQSYVLGLLAIIGDDYIIKSNSESGEGRYDIMLIPHDKNKVGIVIEIKQITRNENETDDKFHQRIDSKIQEALNQIKTNKYYKELLDNKVTEILKLPIVFAGKEPYISLINKEKK
jgi:hypothetical protein